LIAVAAFAESEAKFQLIEGENLTNAAIDFNYRWQYSEVLNISLTIPMVSLPKKAFVWTSGSVDAHAANASAMANANGLASIALPPTDTLIPMAALGYGTGEASVKIDLSNLLEKELSGQGVAVLKGGMVGIAAISLQEMKPDGTAANKRKLMKGACDAQEIKDGSVTGMTCTMYQDEMKITITYVSSTEAGVLNYANTPVSPRSVDMIIEVDGFPLTDDNNHARLDFALVTGNGMMSVEGNASVIVKNNERVYAALSSHCIVNNKIEAVTVTINASGDISAVDAFSQLILDYVIDGNLTGNIAHVDFPAGVRSFVYDPAAGAGTVVYDAEPKEQPVVPPTPTGASSTVALSLLAALVCALLFLF